MSGEKFWLLGLIIVAPAIAADFAKDIQPIFEKSCYSCHGPKQQMGGLRLDSKTLALAAIQPGKPADSTLSRGVAAIGDQPRMPMGGKPLEPAQLAAIRNWIEQTEVP